jgi:predicted NUDIX family NTP pyrophosphohydrolase
MSKKSAGLLLYRKRGSHIEVLLVHPGGPYWVNRDDGAWSIPKGEIDEDEDALEAAMREFREETGVAPSGEFIPLTPIRQAGGKLVHAWALKSDFDPADLASIVFLLEWPPKSGRYQQFPEVDRAEWLSIEGAKHKILKAQMPLLLELEAKVGSPQTNS